MKTVTITRKVTNTLISQANQANINLDEYDLVPITYLDSSTIHDALRNNTYPIIFTSNHAVKAIAKLCKTYSIPLQNKQAFCIDGNTLTTAIDNGFEILASAKSGQLLAELIIKSGCKHLIHFTANIRRDEMYTILSNDGIIIDPCEVYHKTFMPQIVKVKDGIVFYSPSQVITYFIGNTLNKNIPAFCIGQTTANQLSTYKHPLIIISNNATDQEMMNTVITYFNQHS